MMVSTSRDGEAAEEKNSDVSTCQNTRCILYPPCTKGNNKTTTSWPYLKKFQGIQETQIPYFCVSILQHKSYVLTLSIYFTCPSTVFPFCLAKLVQANKHLQQQGTVEVEKHYLRVKTKHGGVYTWHLHRLILFLIPEASFSLRIQALHNKINPWAKLYRTGWR